jgi:replication-associated recombination protein RarA
MPELYQKYRPRTWDEVVGQDEAVAVLRGLFKRPGGPPRAILFEGPTGTGKTTLARIAARSLGIDDRWVREVNCATCEPMDEVRRIEEKAATAPLAGPAHAWILNEAQSLSRAGFAQQGLLDVLENENGFGYFFFTTTDSSKINEAVRNRCTPITLRGVPPANVRALVGRVASREKIVLPGETLEAIVNRADGSPRRALVYLEMVATGRAVTALDEPDERDEVFEIVRGLKLYGGGTPSWQTLGPLLEKYKDKDPEGIRQMILAAARTALIKKGDPRAKQAIQVFRDFYPGGGAAGKAFLAADVHTMCGGK